MANLYIFGNGFDIHHDLPTKYIEFKRFLETEYGCSELGLFLMHLPESTMDNHGGYIIEQNNKKEAAQFLYNVIQESVNDDKWTDFEESLGNIECLDLFYSDIMSTQYADDEWKDLGMKETLLLQASTDLYTNMELISKLFTEWVESIDLTDKKPDPRFVLKFNSTDIFLNFNYTTTLEDLYECKTVTHIHGKAGKDRLVIGHCTDYTTGNSDSDLFDDIRDNGLKDIHNLLKKPTKRIIRDNDSFFSSIANVDSIIVFGWGYGKVDYDYFRKIKDAVKPTTKWILCYHEDKSNAEIFKQELNINGDVVLDENFLGP